MRPMTHRDLEYKGFPGACNNCGNKPTPEDVVKHNGSCTVCGDEIITYSIDTAQLILKLTAQSSQPACARDAVVDGHSLPVVAGRRLPGSNDEFERSCLVALMRVQVWPASELYAQPPSRKFELIESNCRQPITIR